ncbi:asparaginase domain-containing protein [Aquabacterium sp. J223]|uniref:asparaginase domain-containing protein n=1 Tax=Aquabacterium sp. J223 TaxID=2898431 RepID=UPI0028966A4B|nr:asparaginase domain-containing protein [Aquabacterium sp. J223]
MPSTSSSVAPAVLLLGTGGTIAGVSPAAGQPYVAGVLPAQALVAGLALPPGAAVRPETVAAIDSKDMDGATWARLARRLAAALGEPWAGVVVAHGTDTLEETAYLLARLADPRVPVVLTGAMRPADAAEADGPRHLAHAVAVAASGSPSGVWVAWEAGCTGRGACASCTAGGWTPSTARSRCRCRRRSDGRPCPTRVMPGPGSRSSPATAMRGPAGVQALVDAGVQGLVVAGTGNGTVHARLLAALEAAAAQGVAVWWTSRCAFGGLAEGRPDGGRLSGPPRPPGLLGLAAPLLRLELVLQLALRRRAAQPTTPSPPSISA